MSSLNISLPNKLRDWVNVQVESGEYVSASDYLRDLIRADQRKNNVHDHQWLGEELKSLANTPNEAFLRVNADDVKARARQRLKDQESD